MPTLGAIHDVAEEIAQRSTAIANLCVVRAGEVASEHVHANPYLWLHVLGAYRDVGDAGDRFITGPAAIFFPAGSAHSMAVREEGLASVIVEFDAHWLRRRLGPAVDLHRPRAWIGGVVGREAHRLARLWLCLEASADRFARTEAFLRAATARAAPRAPPAWLDGVDALPGLESLREFDRVAQAGGRGKASVARAYRRWRGEGLGPALRRRKVAAAAILMESTNLPLAEIAVAAGFYDQSHMNRGFKLVVGRTPAAIRAARLGLVRAREPHGAPR